jgi:hypothetical protein
MTLNAHCALDYTFLITATACAGVPRAAGRKANLIELSEIKRVARGMTAQAVGSSAWLALYGTTGSVLTRKIFLSPMKRCP